MSAEERKNDYQAFCDACSCDECSTKIMELMDFKKEIKSKRKLVTEYELRLEDTEDLCLLLSDAADWTKRMLDFLQKKLQTVYENLGVSLTLKKSKSVMELEDLDLRIAELISHSGLVKSSGIVYANEVWAVKEAVIEPTPYELMANKIDTGLYYYEKSKVKDKAYCLLQKILDIEKEHEEAKKSDKPLDPSFSKEQIGNQIKLLKKLPVMELHLEVEELIAKLSPIDNYWKMLRKADEYIINTRCAMISVRREFWRRYQVFPSLTSNGNGKEHSLNGLNQTLESLLDKANSFKIQWDQEFAPFFTPYDRPDPKRQRTES